MGNRLSLSQQLSVSGNSMAWGEIVCPTPLPYLGFGLLGLPSAQDLYPVSQLLGVWMWQLPCDHLLPQELTVFRSWGRKGKCDQNILFKTFKELSLKVAADTPAITSSETTAVPLTYAGKLARDIFTKDYSFDFVKCGFKMRPRMDWNLPAQAPPTRRPSK